MLFSLRKLILFILISPLANSCVTLSYFKYPHIDERVQPYVDTFLAEADKRDLHFDTSNIVIQITNVPDIVEKGKPGRTIGTCYQPYVFEKAYVILDKRWWKYATNYDKESTVLHELGHCFLQREHRDETLTLNGDDIPLSIMNSYAPQGFNYLLYREYYIEELFAGAPDEIWQNHKRGKKIPCLMLKTCK